MDVLVICGAAGVGKSTIAWELGHQLAADDVRHAIIDTDELDRVFPKPQPLSELVGLTRQNLTAVWGSFALLGHTRLILSGVMVDLNGDLQWIQESLEEAHVTVIRLRASDDTLRARVGTREIGSGREKQIERSLQQSETIRRLDGNDVAFTFDTDAKRPTALAKDILSRTRWGS